MTARSVALVALLALQAAPALAQEGGRSEPQKPIQLDYKAGEYFPLTLVHDLDAVEPFFPVAAVEQRDFGRIVLGTALPYALLASAFAAQPTDQHTLHVISRWGWAGIDQGQDNYPFLFGMVALAGASAFLPAPEDKDGYSLLLRLDRFAVFGLGVGLANAEVELLRPVFNRLRPDQLFAGGSGTGRPSGHAATTFAAAAFLSNVLRDTLRPQEETSVPLRIAEETATALPYLGGFYMALERVHGYKHFLSDTLLGGALGVFTMQIFYEWSFLRTELGHGWTESFSLACVEGRGLELALRTDF